MTLLVYVRLCFGLKRCLADEVSAEKRKSDGKSHGITLKGISQVILASAEEGDKARREEGRRNGIRKREMSLGDSVWLRWIRNRPAELFMR